MNEERYSTWDSFPPKKFFFLKKPSFTQFEIVSRRLQRRLQMELERREALCRHLSESESR